LLSYPDYPIKTIQSLNSPVLCLGTSPDGTLVAAGQEDGTITLFETETGKPIRTINAHTKRINDLQFSPDQQYLASASSDQFLKIWHVSDTWSLYNKTKCNNPIYRLKFSPDSRHLASIFHNNDLVITDIKQKTVSKQSYDSFFISDICFSQSGKHLFTSSFDKKIRMILLSDLEVVHVKREDWGFTNFNFNKMALNPDGQHLVCYGLDNDLIARSNGCSL